MSAYQLPNCPAASPVASGTALPPSSVDAAASAPNDAAAPYVGPTAGGGAA